MPRKPIKANLLDRAIGYFSPATGAKRLKARADQGGWFEAANVTRHRPWTPIRAQDSKFTATSWARTVCLSHARYLADNIGFIKGALNRLADLTAGTHGLIGRSLSADTAFADAATAYFAEWGKYCDFSARLQWADVCHLLILGMLRDGDIGVILTESPTGVPKLQLVEGHRIGDGYDLSGTTADIDGVVLNGFGQPTAYNIVVSGDPYSADTKLQPVAAKDFILFTDFTRADAVRGISALAHAVNNASDISQILSAEKDGVKYNSSQAAFLTTLTGEADSADWDARASGVSDAAVGNVGNPDPSALAVDDVTNLKMEDVYSGNIRRLAPGEKVDLLKSDRPNTNFTPFLDYLARDIAAGLGVPLEFVWDSNRGGANQRFITAVAQRRIDKLQALLIRRFSNRVWGWVIAKASKRGDLPPLPDDWHRVRWQPTSAKITVDAGREAREARADWQCGLRTLEEDLAERAIDPQQHLEQRGKEAAMAVSIAAKNKVPLWMLWQGTPNGNPLDPEDMTETANAIAKDRPETGDQPVEDEEDAD